MKTLLLTLLCFCFCCSSLYSLDLYAYCQKTIEESDQLFLENFPFSEYLENFNWKNIKKLEEHRILLNENGRNGSNFLFKLSEVYLKSNPPKLDNLTDLGQKIKIGETFLYLENFLPDIYPAIGDYMLSETASVVEKGVAEKKVNPENPEFLYIINRLQENSYFIDLPTSNYKKFVYHAKEGNWIYIWSRVKNRYLLEFIILLVVGFGTIGFLGRWWMVRRKKKAHFSANPQI